MKGLLKLKFVNVDAKLSIYRLNFREPFKKKNIIHVHSFGNEEDIKSQN